MDNRLPPGQRLLSSPDQFPVLDLGVQPDWNKDDYRLKIHGLVDQPVEWSYAEILQLPASEFTADFHCVTRWSKYDVVWKGVSWAEIEKLVKPKAEAKFAIQHGLDGYTTNSSLAELRKPNVFIA